MLLRFHFKKIDLSLKVSARLRVSQKAKHESGRQTALWIQIKDLHNQKWEKVTNYNSLGSVGVLL